MHYLCILSNSRIFPCRRGPSIQMLLNIIKIAPSPKPSPIVRDSMLTHESSAAIVQDQAGLVNQSPWNRPGNDCKSIITIL